MKYTDTTPTLSAATALENVAGQIRKEDVTIITRPNGHNRFDLCMLVPMWDDEPHYAWVWLNGESIGFQSARGGRTRQEIASTLISGGWTIRPNATIALEGIPELRQAAVAHSEFATVIKQADGYYACTTRNRSSASTTMNIGLKRALEMFSDHLQKKGKLL